MPLAIPWGAAAPNPHLEKQRIHVFTVGESIGKPSLAMAFLRCGHMPSPAMNTWRIFFYMGWGWGTAVTIFSIALGTASSMRQCSD